MENDNAGNPEAILFWAPVKPYAIVTGCARGSVGRRVFDGITGQRGAGECGTSYASFV